MATAEFCIFYDQDGKNACNTGYIIHDALTISDFQAVADAFWNNWCSLVIPNLSNAIETTQMVMKDVDGPWEVNAATAVSKVGGTVIPALPPNCAVGLTRTDAISRYKGRWYIPGVPESDVDDAGNILPSFGSNLAANFPTIATNMLGFSNAKIANRHAVGGLPGSYVYVSVDSYGYISTVVSQKQRRF